MYEYRCSVSKVVDGDTMHVCVDLGMEVKVSTTIRIYGIDAPELKTPEGKKTKAVVEQWVAEHNGQIVVNTFKDRREKYGRYLGVISAEGVSLGELLVNLGLAKRYDGGAR